MEKVLEQPYNSWLINPRLTLLVANAVLWCEIVSAKNKELADLNAVTSSKSFISFVKRHKSYRQKSSSSERLKTERANLGQSTCYLSRARNLYRITPSIRRSQNKTLICEIWSFLFTLVKNQIFAKKQRTFISCKLHQNNTTTLVRLWLQASTHCVVHTKLLRPKM